LNSSHPITWLDQLAKGDDQEGMGLPERVEIAVRDPATAREVRAG